MTTAVLTGSSTGIGYATALRLARDGHHVIATMRAPGSSDLASVAEAEGLSLETRALDVTDQSSVDGVFSDVLKNHGSVDVLVNNAGISRSSAFEETDLETFAEIMETNYIGAIRCTKAVLPGMRDVGSGCIVNVSSQAGRMPAPVLSAYCGSKWALEGVMETLAIEVACHGIRVVLIEPGAIITPIIGKGGGFPEDTPYDLMYKRFGHLAMHDFGRGSSPEVVADTISESITTPEPKLRWLCGQGAERNIATRESMSDEQFIDIWNVDDQGTFNAKMLGDDPS
jgi:NAD(P)-dependent dehydrogenase (short-subunit alcohol dehydrogenase family)